MPPKTRLTRNACLATLACCFLVTMAQADWNEFRGRGGNSVANSSKLPLTWDAKKNVAWKRTLPGRGPSGPILVGDRVFVSCSAGLNQDRLFILAFDAGSGKELWRRHFWATGRTLSHPLSSNAAPTPASDGKHIFAFYSSNDLVCLDLEGNLKWFRGLAHDYPKAGNDVGMASSPVVVDKTVVVQVENQGDSFAAGIHTETGQERWRIRRPTDANWVSPLVLRDKGRNVVLLQSPSIGLTGHDPRTGEELWRFEGGCSSAASSVTGKGLLFVPRAGLTAFKLSGRSAPQLMWQKAKYGSNYSSPIFDAGRVYVLSGAIAKCADVKTGREIWRKRLKGKRFWITPILSRGRLYYINQEGLVQTLDTKTGELLASGAMKDTILGSPAVSADALFIRSEKQLWKISEQEE